MAYTDKMKEERSELMRRIADQINHDDAWSVYQQGSIDADRLRDEELEIKAFCQMMFDYDIWSVENEFMVGISGMVLFREMYHLGKLYPEWGDFYPKAYKFLTEEDGYEKVARLAGIYTAKKDFVKGIASGLVHDDESEYLDMLYCLQSNGEFIAISKKSAVVEIDVTANSNESNYMEIYREVYGNGAIGRKVK